MPLESFEILFFLNITALFYLAFDYIPRLERDVEKSYERKSYLEEVKNKRISGLLEKEIDEAIEANKAVIKAFTTYRSIKVYLPLFLLSIPLISIPLSILLPRSFCIPCIPFLYETWSLMLFFGIVIPFITTVGAMARYRPYSKYEKIHRKAECVEKLC